MICPNCQAKFNGFRMGKEINQHLIECGNCKVILIPSTASFNMLKQKKSVALIVIGLVYIIMAYLGNQIMLAYSDWYFYLLLILLAIAGSKVYITIYKSLYEKNIQFNIYTRT